MTLGKSFASLGNYVAQYQNQGGFAKPSKYEIIITPPSLQTFQNMSAGQIPSRLNDLGGLSETIRQTSLSCESISFPGRNIDTTPDTNIYGPVREIATGFSYAEVSATFRCSKDMREKRYFESWQRLAYDPQSWNIGYYYDYVGKIQVYQLDEKDQRKYGVELIECFPKTIAAQTLDYGAQNQQQKVSVTFSYRYWKSLTDEADLPRPLQDRIANILQNTVERRLQAAIPAVLQRL